MAVTVESLLEQAKTLPDLDREELARRLYDTLPPLPEMPQAWDNEEEAEAAWQAQLQWRLDSIADGTAHWWTESRPLPNCANVSPRSAAHDIAVLVTGPPGLV